MKYKKLLKKFQNEMFLKLPKDLIEEQVDIWFQDEARFGEKNTTTRLWAEKGTRPRAVKQQQFEYAYLFGAVCPATGETEAIVAPCVNKEVMRQHLKQISETTKSERHTVVIMDGAGWHTDDIVEEFENVSIIKLPPYSPELNSIEQVWSWMRENCIANRSFSGFEDIVNVCCDACEKFRKSSERVKNLCSRDWINLI